MVSLLGLVSIVADLPTQTASSLISAKEVIVNRGGDSENEGTVLAHNAVLQADNLTHTGQLRAQDITMMANDTFTSTGNMTAVHKHEYAINGAQVIVTSQIVERDGQEKYSFLITFMDLIDYNKNVDGMNKVGAVLGVEPIAWKVSIPIEMTKEELESTGTLRP